MRVTSRVLVFIRVRDIFQISERRTKWVNSSINNFETLDKTIYVLLRVLKFCIDRLSIDNAVFYHGMSPGTSPGTHMF